LILPLLFGAKFQFEEDKILGILQIFATDYDFNLMEATAYIFHENLLLRRKLFIVYASKFHVNQLI